MIQQSQKMKAFLIILVLLELYACNSEGLAKYERLVSRADRIVIKIQEYRDSLVLLPGQSLERLKYLLKEDVVQQTPRKFRAKRLMTLYSGEQRIAELLVSAGKAPAMNFRSQKLNTTFILNTDVANFIEDVFPSNKVD